jgi:hypothetical protein
VLKVLLPLVAMLGHSTRLLPARGVLALVFLPAVVAPANGGSFILLDWLSRPLILLRL